MENINIDPNNFNAWRKTIKPDAQDYVFGVDANKDKEAYDWAVKNKYDNTKSYIPQAPSVQEAPEPKTRESLVDEAAKTGKSYLQLYKENFPAPVYDQKKAGNVQKAKNLSIIADILKTVGEGVTTKKGGTPVQRQSVAPQLDAELGRLNEVYKNEIRAYKQGGFNAMVQDEREKQSQTRQNSILKAQAIRDANNLKKWELEFLAKNDKATKDDAYRASMLKLREQQNRISAAKGSGSGSSTKDDEKFKYIIVNGKSMRIPISYINDVAARAKGSLGTTIDPATLSMQPEQLFATNWQKYYDINDSGIYPKQAKTQVVERKVAKKDINVNNYDVGTDGKYRPKAQTSSKQVAPATKTNSDPLGLNI